jgi:protein gp37
MKKEWVENIQRQCAQAGVPFFFKQWGGVHKKASGRILNGKVYSQMPGAAAC